MTEKLTLHRHEETTRAEIALWYTRRADKPKLIFHEREEPMTAGMRRTGKRGHVSNSPDVSSSVSWQWTRRNNVPQQVRRLMGGVRPSGFRECSKYVVASIALRFLATFPVRKIIFSSCLGRYTFKTLFFSFSFWFFWFLIVCVFLEKMFFQKKKFLTFGQVKSNTRHGRPRHQPKFSSLYSESCDPKSRNKKQQVTRENEHCDNADALCAQPIMLQGSRQAIARKRVATAKVLLDGHILAHVTVWLLSCNISHPDLCLRRRDAGEQPTSRSPPNVQPNLLASLGSFILLFLMNSRAAWCRSPCLPCTCVTEHALPWNRPLPQILRAAHHHTALHLRLPRRQCMKR